MTIKDCIDIVDNIKPNQYTIREKVMWLSFVDETIINDVLKTHEGYDGRYDGFEGYTEDKLSVSLIVKSPYDRLYTAYLKMKIDQENGETARYNNSAALYNTYLMEFRKYYNKTHMPIDATKQRPMIPQKHTVGLSDAEYENLKRDLTYILTEHFSSTISHDKVYAVVNEFVQNNIHLLRVSPEEIKLALVEYLEKNPIKIDVPEWALKPEKPTYTAGEVGTYSKDEIVKLHSQFIKKETYDTDMSKKAAKATTLDGYGITDAYTKNEVDESLSKKTEEIILYEDVVNTPEWTNQPAYEGKLDSSFNVNDFYYVTLKDADGNALPSGQFMLKDSYTDDSTVYSTVFLLPDLATGEDTLVENFPVEFTETGTTVTLRDAGVSVINQDIVSWNICNGTGSIRSVLQGEVIPRNTNLYCYSHFKTDKNVASYHSSNGTTAFSGNSTKDIVPYTTIPELANVGNILFDDAVLKKDGNGYFSVERKFVVRYNENYKNAKSYQVFGFGKALSDDINITSVALRMNSDKNGMFRNGTKIIVSEVK